MADDERKKLEEEKKRKQTEIERKRAEVRARMEEASKAKKAKKGFMTPERKKKLRLLLRKKAAEELKKEQERKAAERRRIIEERCGKPKILEDTNEGQLKRICKDYYDRMYICEEQKWDLEREVRKRDWEISDLNSQVNDLRGKFVKPTLKKVSKYENKFAKLQKKAAEFNFRNQLKVVKKKEFTLEEEDKEKKPDWSKKGGEKDGEEGEDQSSAEGQSSADGQPPTEEAPFEGQPAAEGQPPAEGQPAVEGQPPAEGQQTTGDEASVDGEAPKEGEEAVPKEPTPEPPETSFETFKKLVMNENYDIIALPETVLAPTDDKEAVSIPHYSLVENRRNSGDGTLMYIKDSLKYKVVDLTNQDPEAAHQVSFEELLERLKKNASYSGQPSGEEAPVEGAPPAEGTSPTEGGPPTEGAPATEDASTTEGAPATEAAPAEATAPAESSEATTEQQTDGAAPTPDAPTAETAESAPAAAETGPAPEESEPPQEIPSGISSPPVIEAAA